MAGSVNKVILIGNLGRDPELRSTQDGTRIANLAVATSESWRDRVSGERKERTEWHRVVIFNERLAEIAEKYLKKGSKVYVEGALQTRKWTDQGGQERYSTEVVLQRFRGELTMLEALGRPRRRLRRPADRGRLRRRLRRRDAGVSPRDPGSRPHPRQRPRRRHPVLRTWKGAIDRSRWSSLNKSGAASTQPVRRRLDGSDDHRCALGAYGR